MIHLERLASFSSLVSLVSVLVSADLFSTSFGAHDLYSCKAVVSIPFVYWIVIHWFGRRKSAAYTTLVTDGLSFAMKL